MDIKLLQMGLLKAKTKGTPTYIEIANTIYKIINNKKIIKNVADIVKIANVSYSAITKFIKFIDFDNAKILIALINESIKKDDYKENKNIDPLINNVALEIQKARKIFFVGTSSNYYINSSFANKLQRLDKWVVVPIHKYEQIGISKLQIDRDLMIVTSPSLQHEWINDILKNTRGKKILLTAGTSKHADYIFRAKKYERVDSLRMYTIDTSIQFEKFFGDIFKKLIEDEGNKILLKVTRYIK